MFNPMDFTGRRFLVTGASSGIGRSTAELLARLGGRVALAGRDMGRLEAVLPALEGEGHEASAFDLADTDGIPGWIGGLAKAGGGFAGIAHCAGIQKLKPLRASTTAFVDEILRVNVGAAIAIARAFRQKDVALKPGSLVLISSTAGMTGQAGNVVYTASKGAIIAATRGIAMELVRDGIRVNCVAPALVRTPMSEQSIRVWTAEQFAGVLALHPMGIGTAEDVADAVAFLLSDMAKWITGTTLVVDGGYTAQ